MRIPDRLIIEYVGMAELPLIVYLLYLKYGGSFRLIDLGKDCMIRFGRTNVANMSYLAAVLHFIRVEDAVLGVEGNVSLPAVFRERCVFYAIVNGRRRECAFAEAGMDRKIAGEPYETRTVFRLECPLEEDTPCEIVFAIGTDGVESICGKINAQRFCPAADCLEEQYAVRSGWIIKMIRNSLCLLPAREERVRECEKAFQARIRAVLPEQAERICGIREAYFERKRRKTKQLWLFFDRIDKADDNGEAMFSYVCARHREDVEACFVIGRHSPDFERLRVVGKVVEALSFEHCVLLLLADYILTSQLNGYVENPFGEYEEYFRDLSHQPRVVFLQHGVTKDDQTIWLNRYYQNLHAIVVSAQAERTALVEGAYFYQPKQVWLTGMPRYDVLDCGHAQTEGPRCILFMPTWRENLMEQRLNEETHTYRWCLRENFWDSEYYRRWHSLLNSAELIESCQRSGYRAVFMPHPILQPYIREFRADREVLTFPYDTSWRELFARCSLMVTDYSSVAFDFAYLEKPVVYYQFDRDSFFTSHTYQKGYFDYETMGFGETVTEERELVDLLGRCMGEGCRMPERYRERVNRFFFYRDHNNCERIFRKIIEEESGSERQEALEEQEVSQ